MLASACSRRLAWRTAALALAWALAGAAADAATWVVGRDAPSIAEALRRAANDDVIELPSGTYRGDVAVIEQRRLTIRGVGARPVVVADGRHAEGKAIWVVRNGDVTIENVELRGARVPATNGAGIRFERGRLRIVRCAFYDNEMGILTGNVADAELIVEDSEFGAAPHHEGNLHHLLYAGRIARLSVSGSRFSQGWRGHLIKSRAHSSLIANNVIVDGPLGEASYEVDLPNGGLARLVGNTIGQSERTQNATIVAYGAEGSVWPGSALSVEGNTLVNERAGDAWFVRVWTERLPPDTPIEVRGNRLVGGGRLSLGAGAVDEGNVALPSP